MLNEPSPSLPAGQYSPELLDFVAHCLRKVRVRVRVRDRVRVRVRDRVRVRVSYPSP